uniref:Helix-turn-helix transcriptional regulator n=1 Tax=Roseihalotalea indica TaxID=2867963 RepID=A0AA49JE33_9BACT|nr:helix-turn-helix transcriptional regulator [Tunicatimonas sp. TK19036]
MILHHQKFDFKGQCLIEKVIIEAPFRFAVDFHDEACFIYFSEGTATLNSPHEQTRIAPQESVLLKCGPYFADLIQRHTAGRYDILVFHLFPHILRTLYQHELPSFVKPSERKSFIRKVVPDDTVQKFVESLYFYFDHPSLVSDDLLELKVKELILLLVQTKNATSIERLFAELFTPREVTIQEVVQQHLFSDISVEDLARLAHTSVSTFNRQFQNLFQSTPANYIKTKRLERARELLAVSTFTVGEIAFQTGFHDVAHFSRSFKAAYGTSPSDYRLSVNKA